MKRSLQAVLAALFVAGATIFAVPLEASASDSGRGQLLKRQPAGMSLATQRFKPKCPPAFVMACKKNEVRVCAQTDAKACCTQVFCEPR